MILDKFENAKQYAGLGKIFEVALEAAGKLNADSEALEFEVDGKQYCFKAGIGMTGSTEGRQYEIHRAYADVQFVLSGAETLYYNDSYNCTEFDTERDFALVDGTGATVPVTLKPGMFCILFPEEAHMPGCNVGDTAGEEKKIVIKIKMN